MCEGLFSIWIRSWTASPLARLGGLVLILTLVSVPASGQTRDYAYVLNSDSDVVSVLDTATHTVVATIPVGMYPVDVAFTPDRNQAYVVNLNSDNVSIIGTQTDRVEHTVDLGAQPRAVAIAATPDGRGPFAYVPTYSPDPPRGSVVVIDTSANPPSIVATVAVADTPESVALSPDGGFAWVTIRHGVSVINTRTIPPTVEVTVDLGSAEPAPVAIVPNGLFAYVGASIYSDPPSLIWVINTTTRELERTIDLGDRLVPSRIAFTVNPNRAYAPVFHDDLGGGAGLVEIDTDTHAQTRSLGLGGEFFSAYGVAIKPDQSRVYVTGSQTLRGDANVVWEIDTATLDLDSTVNVRSFPGAIAVAELQRPNFPRIACVAHYSGGTSISLIDTDTDAVVASIPIGGFLGGVARTPNGDFCYVANYSFQSVYVVDTAQRTVSGAIDLRLSPTAIAVTPQTSAGVFAWVGGNGVGGDDNIAVIDTASQTVVGTVNVDFRPTAIAITPDGTRAYVTELAGADSELSVIDTASLTVSARIRTGLNNPFALAISPDGAFAYVGSGLVMVLDTNPGSPTFHTEVARVETGTVSGSALAISPSGSLAYVGTTSDTVKVIFTADHRVVDTVPVGRAPYGIGFTNSGAFAFVTNSVSADVSVLETATGTVVATVPVADSPYWVTAR